MVDRQVIVAFRTGVGDAAVRSNSENLQEKFFLAAGNDFVKGTTDRIIFDANAPSDDNWQSFDRLRAAFSRLTQWSRVYLLAHGDWQAQQIGSYDAKLIAHLLWANGMPAVHHITVVACRAARSTHDDGTGGSAGTAIIGRVQNSNESFVSKMHELLYKSHKIKTVAYGYTYFTATIKKLNQNNVAQANVGKKHSVVDGSNANTPNRQTPFSKKKYYWKGDKQMWDWVY